MLKLEENGVDESDGESEEESEEEESEEESDVESSSEEDDEEESDEEDSDEDGDSSDDSDANAKEDDSTHHLSTLLQLSIISEEMNVLKQHLQNQFKVDPSKVDKDPLQLSPPYVLNDRDPVKPELNMESPKISENQLGNAKLSSVSGLSSEWRKGAVSSFSNRFIQAARRRPSSQQTLSQSPRNTSSPIQTWPHPRLFEQERSLAADLAIQPMYGMIPANSHPLTVEDLYRFDRDGPTVPTQHQSQQSSSDTSHLVDPMSAANDVPVTLQQIGLTSIASSSDRLPAFMSL